MGGRSGLERCGLKVEEEGGNLLRFMGGGLGMGEGLLRGPTRCFWAFW